jgi:hypothetical protein
MGRLWLLSFVGEIAVIIEAESTAHARLLVTANGLERASRFVEGCPIDPDFVPLIPAESIGRKLSPEDTRELLMLLKNGPRRQSVKPDLPLPGFTPLH